MATQKTIPQVKPPVRITIRLPRLIDDELEYERTRSGLTKQAIIQYALCAYLKLGAA